jgi:hypothetical protein
MDREELEQVTDWHGARALSTLDPLEPSLASDLWVVVALTAYLTVKLVSTLVRFSL